jgi:hypothetical protein
VNETPPIFGWIYRNLTWIIPLVAAIFGGIWYWLQRMVFDPLNSHKKSLKAIRRIIPVEAIEGEYMLQTIQDCTKKLDPVIEHQNVLRRIIPFEATEKGYMLQTLIGCGLARERCSISAVVSELGNDIKTILASQTADNKKLITAMTTLTNRLPLDAKDREAVLKELI